MFYSPQFRQNIAVNRVAGDGSWADITVQNVGISSGGLSWNKRQPLRDGAFPFEVEELKPFDVKNEAGPVGKG
jgi:hypothetical protein